MQYDIADVQTDRCADDSILVYWLGGSGFVFKSPGGKIVCIDPYLSDAVERMFGFRRLSLSPITADALHFDLLLLTHDHADHLDPDSFGALMRANPNCRVWSSASCDEYLTDTGASYAIAAPGDTTQIGDVSITAVHADHGELCPDALGFLLTFGTRTLYFTGDTADNTSVFAPAIDARPEIVIPCINGAFGNMNEAQAAKLVEACRSSIAIPSHFWLFAEHGGSPGAFVDLVAKSPDARVQLLTPGSGIEL